MNGHASIPIYLHTFRFPVLVVPGCATSAPSFHLVSAPPDGLSSSMLRRSSPTPPPPPPSLLPPRFHLFCYLRCCSAYLHPLSSFHGGGLTTSRAVSP
ncbi:hypothetical protein I7I52_07636 [Histoplasma capsulatum]|uniref:Uncharacterized protein n=1 Tax=Ajellomyces capsulatus TaxID=5037 RepID=A0A8H7YIV9_AJECA|nr:hypothetical protein I7I52_07636 [Histoplasma capsulatum]